MKSAARVLFLLTANIWRSHRPISQAREPDEDGGGIAKVPWIAYDVQFKSLPHGARILLSTGRFDCGLRAGSRIDVPPFYDDFLGYLCHLFVILRALGGPKDRHVLFLVSSVCAFRRLAKSRSFGSTKSVEPQDLIADAKASAFQGLIILDRKIPGDKNAFNFFLFQEIQDKLHEGACLLVFLFVFRDETGSRKDFVDAGLSFGPVDGKVAYQDIFLSLDWAKTNGSGAMNRVA